MNHFMMDAFNGYRSRLDDMMLVHELLEELPLKLGMKPVMPPFILPYYNGVIPEDCGISAFVFLAGGHFTIHTFSFREVYFVDLVTPEPCDTKQLENSIRAAFPAERVTSFCLERENKPGYPRLPAIDETMDFGPHLFLDFNNYSGPQTMDDLFELFDTMPFKIGMTPIIRPYVVTSKVGTEKVLSILTMIAESHISLHYFVDSKRAYLDLFSCRFFNYQEVVQTLKRVFKSPVTNETLIARGSKYQLYKTASAALAMNSRAWVENVHEVK
jgi:S-adenosylmethionine/arginine decarboxylase-like enzyme